MERKRGTWGRGLGWMVLAFICGNAWGAAGEPVTSTTTHSTFSLSEIVITGSRTKESAFESPRAVSVTSLKKGDSGEYQRTLPDATREMPGVFLQKTTHGHGTPVVRGFIGRDVLMMVDGIRLNNSTFRSGPVQYLNTVDIGSVDRVELMRGPGSVLYGSDALGGALNVRTSSTFPSAPLSVKVAAQAQSAAREATSRAEVSGSLGDWGYRVGVNAKSFGDLRAGGGYGIESPTGYGETDGDASFRWRIDPSQALSVMYQTVSQSQVPRYHHYQGATRVYGVPAFQRFTYDQVRHLGILRYEGQGVAGFDGMETAISWQRQFEGNQQRRIGSPTTTELEDHVETIGGYGQVTELMGDHVFVAGAEVYSDTIQSLAWSLNATAGTKTARPMDSTFPDGSKYTTLGLFAQDQWRLGSVEITPGLRWSRFSYNTTLRNMPFSGALEDAFQDVTGSISASVEMAPSWRIMGTIGQGFRAPNLDDLATLRTTNQGVDVPVSSALRPEKALMGELGVKMLDELAEGSVFFYGMDITDRIVRKAGIYQGLSFIDINGNGTRDTGELSVFQKQNIGQAQMFGVEMDGRCRVTGDLSVFGALGWTYGQNVTDNEPLSKIPPLNGRLGVRFAASDRWVEGLAQFAGLQDRLSTTDKTDPRMDPNGTSGWATLNIRGGITVSEGMRLKGGVQNLLDAGYREHGSGVDAPGFNASVGMEVQF